MFPLPWALHRPTPPHHLASSSWGQGRTSEEEEHDDQTAQELLTAFPTYGTAASTTTSSSGLWTDEDENDDDQQEEKKGGDYHLHLAAHPPTNPRGEAELPPSASFSSSSTALWPASPVWPPTAVHHTLAATLPLTSSSSSTTASFFLPTSWGWWGEANTPTSAALALPAPPPPVAPAPVAPTTEPGQTGWDVEEQMLWKENHNTLACSYSSGPSSEGRRTEAATAGPAPPPRRRRYYYYWMDPDGGEEEEDEDDSPHPEEKHSPPINEPGPPHQITPPSGSLPPPPPPPPRPPSRAAGSTTKRPLSAALEARRLRQQQQQAHGHPPRAPHQAPSVAADNSSLRDAHRDPVIPLGPSTNHNGPSSSVLASSHDQHHQDHHQPHDYNGRSLWKKDGQQQHWMPDQYCKQCYACDVPFTVFRRRHHCRLCGQVFCNTCSAYFVPWLSSEASAPPLPSPSDPPQAGTLAAPGSSTTSTAGSRPSTIRVCRWCHDHVMSQPSLGASSSGGGEVGGGSVVMRQDHSATPSDPATWSMVSSPSIRTHPGTTATESTTEASVPAGSTWSSPPIVGVLPFSGNSLLPHVHPRDDLASVISTTTSASGTTLSHPLAATRGTGGTASSKVPRPASPHTTAGASLNRPIIHPIKLASLPTLVSYVPGAKTVVVESHSGAATLLVPYPPPAALLPAAPCLIPGAAPLEAAQTGGGRVDDRTVPAEFMGWDRLNTSTLDSVRSGHRHLGLTAARHLELLAMELVRLHAPRLWKEVQGASRVQMRAAVSKSAPDAPNGHHLEDVPEIQQRYETNLLHEERHRQNQWINKLLTLATRCCSTVDPQVKKGDLLDIRPYCKIKVIPGGTHQDCAYLSGVLFRKTVSHKRMAKEILNPRIMLLSGGIEFTRTENRIASLETLFEQEEKYMEILVGKILKLRPSVLLVGRSVSRKAQELLLKAEVVLVQHVKTSLLNRISRQTRATIISSTDHVMNQFGANVLGTCRRFRLVTFRDNEVWSDLSAEADDAILEAAENGVVKKRSIQDLLADRGLSNHERQAALAASQLGQDVLDGAQAIKSGLAKRGVAQTYVMLEGCPKNLGCTVILRGASRAALKQVKAVFRFLVNVAYNLRLETTLLRERGIRLRPDFDVLPQHTCSSSLCVDFGQPPQGRKARPWNGGNSDTMPRLESGDITALDHQAILITSVWMTEKSQCCPAEVKGICYYSLQDVALGQFLRDSCFNLSLKCQNPNCKKTVLDHTLSFVHNDGIMNITVEEMEDELPPSPSELLKEENGGAVDPKSDDDDDNRPIATWTYCMSCQKVVTPLVYISEDTWKYSFGKFLEVFFYNRDAIMNAPELQCHCPTQTSTALYFGCGKLAARFLHERITPLGVFVRRSLPLEIAFHRKEAIRRLEVVSVESSNLFVKFDKHIEKVSREARSLFHTAVNKPEHLQTVLSELNRIGSEVDHAAKTLQEKIVSVSNEAAQRIDRNDGSMDEALLRFPWVARRYLFMLTSSWNEKLSAAGQAITAMRRLAASASNRNDGVIGTNVSAVVGDPMHDELLEGMTRLRLLNEQWRIDVTDITQAFPALPGGSETQQDGEYDDEFDEVDNSIDFSSGVDADVLASRRRLRTAKQQANTSATSRPRPAKSLGTRRSPDGMRPGHDPSATIPPKSTPGGAVKSAFTRFFNRGGRDHDPYVVNLGIFGEGRPRLAPGANGTVVPVFDDQLSTVIAYSLASAEYAKQFKHFSKQEPVVTDEEQGGQTETRLSPTGLTDPEGVSQAGQNARRLGERANAPLPQPSSTGPSQGSSEPGKNVERRMLVRNKSHIKHTFRDFDEKGQVTSKYVCTSYWATQFHAVREIFLSPTFGKSDSSDADSQPGLDIERSYIESLTSAYSWAASGGKSGASFARTSDDRFVIKCISKTELQMFLDCAPAYFEYLSKAFFHGLPTVLCKIVGVYQIGMHNRITGKRSGEQVAVMQNIFYNRRITKIFDLKGSLRGRYAAQIQSAKDDSQSDSLLQEKIAAARKRSSDRSATDDSNGRQSDANSIVDESEVETTSALSVEAAPGPKTLLDGDFLEFTRGRPMPLTDRAKAVFQMSILNDTLFLSIINVLDYSILVGMDEESMELVVGIIDFMRQYDILKQMERVGKSLPMVVGSEAPTIIQPPLYKARFSNAMERYFMTVPSKWTAI